MYLFRDFIRVLRHLKCRIVRVRVNNSEAICIVDMQKLACPNRCQYTGFYSTYMYIVAFEKDGKFSKVQYRLGACAMSILIVEHNIELVIHPGNDSKHVPVCLNMLKQAISHAHVIVGRRVSSAIEYIEC